MEVTCVFLWTVQRLYTDSNLEGKAFEKKNQMGIPGFVIFTILEV